MSSAPFFGRVGGGLSSIRGRFGKYFADTRGLFSKYFAARGGQAVESPIRGHHPHRLGEVSRRLRLLLDEQGVLDRQELSLEHPADRRGFLERVANERVLVHVADALGVLGVCDELVLELALLADGLLDPPNALADLDVALDATFLCRFE